MKDFDELHCLRMEMKENDEVEMEYLQVEMNVEEKMVMMKEWQWMGDPLPKK